MKALELAEQAIAAWSTDRHIENQVLLNRCGIELRRLAEVNAELLGALTQSADLLDERCAGLGAYARSIIAKAKEQQ